MTIWNYFYGDEVRFILELAILSSVFQSSSNRLKHTILAPAWFINRIVTISSYLYTLVLLDKIYTLVTLFMILIHHWLIQFNILNVSHDLLFDATFTQSADLSIAIVFVNVFIRFIVSPKHILSCNESHVPPASIPSKSKVWIINANPITATETAYAN